MYNFLLQVIRDTNFLDGLFTPDELQAENIKDREAKMKFLQKLIDTISKFINLNIPIYIKKHNLFKCFRTHYQAGLVRKNFKDCSRTRTRKDKSTIAGDRNGFGK